MKIINKYLIIERPSDLLSHIVWSHKDSVRIGNIGIIYHEGNLDTYPQFYKCYSSGGGSCDSWCKCNKEEIHDLLIKEIEDLKCKTNELEKILKNWEV